MAKEKTIFSVMKRAANVHYVAARFHPFNQQLFEGTLCPTKFTHYLMQDAYYLNQFSVLLTTLSERLGCEEHKKLVKEFAIGAVLCEQVIHEEFTSTKVEEPCESIQRYLAHLRFHVENSPTCVAIAVTLACYDMYRQLGTDMAIAQTESHHPFRSWIETYSSPDFHTATEQLIGIMHEVAEAKHVPQMIDVFKKSAAHEVCFWDEVDRYSPGIRMRF